MTHTRLRNLPTIRTCPWFHGALKVVFQARRSWYRTPHIRRTPIATTTPCRICGRESTKFGVRTRSVSAEVCRTTCRPWSQAIATTAIQITKLRRQRRILLGATLRVGAMGALLVEWRYLSVEAEDNF